jgi:uncharacterized cupin superfamily protein
MVCHWDDVPWRAYEHGELRFARQRLSAARGRAGATLSRYRIAPGARSMPQHVHVDEEELFYVLTGSGLSWQDDATHEIGAGDLVVHRADRESHTLVAGDGGELEVLAFASGSPTGLTALTRAGITRVGSRRLPSDAPDPYDAEPPAGALPPPAPRPPTIVALADVDAASRDIGPVAGVRRDLGRAAGSVLSGLKHVQVAPGRRSSTRHCHSLEDEIFVVLAGRGVVLLGDDELPVRPGSIVSRPRASGVAHAFQAGDEALTLLAFGTREPGDACWYPDSQKVYLRGLGVIARVQPLDYWDGER